MSVAAFISSQRAEQSGAPRYRLPGARRFAVLLLQVADRPPSPRQRRRAELTAAVRAAFDVSGGTYGSPRITAELQVADWQVSKNTIAAVMAAEQLVARPKRRRQSLTRTHKTARRAPDPLNRDFTAPAPDVKGVEI